MERQSRPGAWRVGGVFKEISQGDGDRVSREVFDRDLPRRDIARERRGAGVFVFGDISHAGLVFCLAHIGSEFFDKFVAMHDTEIQQISS